MTVRSTTEVEESLATSISSVNPGLSTKTGSMRRGIIKPVAPEIQKAEADADHLIQLVSLNFSAASSDAEMDLCARAVSLERKPGKAASGFVTFGTAVRPDALTTLTVPAGTLVGTAQGGLVYQTTEERNLLGSNADAYFNSLRRQFEVVVPVEALAVGEDHNVAPGRITQILGTIDDFSTVTNIDYVDGGLSAESNAELFERIQERMLGIDRGVNGGLVEEARRFDESVKDAVPVYSTDFDLFRRRTTRPAIDLYVSGSYKRLVTDTYTAVGGETSFVLTNQPVITVTSVTVNGLAVSFSVLKDTSRETGGSPIGFDKVVLTAALGVGDQLQVDYEANGLLLDMYQTFGSRGSSRFRTQILPREMRTVQIEVAVTATGLGSFEEITLSNEVTAKVIEYVSPGTRVTEPLTPEKLREKLLSEVAGLSRVNITIFRRVDGGPSFGVITTAKNEIPSTTTDLVKVSIRR